MRILLADTPRSVGRTALVVNWLTECPPPPPPGARWACGPPRPLGGGGSRCPECWGMPGEGTRAARDTCLKAPSPPQRPSGVFYNLPHPAAAATPLYGIHNICCKRAVKCRAVAILEAVGDDRVVLPGSSTCPRFLPLLHCPKFTDTSRFPSLWYQAT